MHKIILDDKDISDLNAILNGVIRYSDINGARTVIALHDKIASQLSSGTEVAAPVESPAAPQGN